MRLVLGKNKVIITGLITAAILIGGVVLFSKSDQQTTSTPPPPTLHEYFWGDGCPHCAKVDEFLSSWEGNDKLEIDKREVYNNRANAQLLSKRAASCGIATNEVGVPLLYTPQGECITGDTPIINFFRNLYP